MRWPDHGKMRNGYKKNRKSENMKGGDNLESLGIKKLLN
jgi:hypothetical protein